jgi:predicted O-methyltransferase YrrM
MSIRQTLIDKLLGGADPFERFKKAKAKGAADDLALPAGWGSTHPYFDRYIAELKPALIIEVGTWLGGSAINMARLLRQRGLNESCIVCIDTWLGAAEHYVHEDHRKVMKLKDGRPTFYEDFLQNVVDHGVESFILPFSIASSAAADAFNQIGVKADLVYLDGDHSERGFRADMDLYWDITRPGGVVIGDDFDWESVRNQMIDFAWHKEAEFSAWKNKFVFRKPA